MTSMSILLLYVARVLCLSIQRKDKDIDIIVH